MDLSGGDGGGSDEPPRRRPRPATPRRVAALSRAAEETAAESSSGPPTPSLLSSAGQPPPSYGTATQLRPLDAGQLANSGSIVLAPDVAGHLAAGQPAAVGQLSRWQQPHQLASVRDNNQESRQSQKQQLATASGGGQLAPINHVISAAGSMASQPQTNQYYWQPARLVHLDSGALQQQQQQSVWAPPASQMGALEHDGRLLLARSISGHSVSVQNQLAKAAEPDWPLTWRRQLRPSQPTSNGAERMRSEENLARHLHHNDNATPRQQPNRKRRRHRSHTTKDSANGDVQQPKWSRPPNQQPAISAHCWLIDSSDEQSVYAANQLARQAPPSKQDQHLTVAMMQQARRQQQLAFYPVGSSHTLHSPQSVRMKSSRSCQALQSRSSSNLSRSSAGSAAGHKGTSTGGSLVRLGALLSMVTTLVRRTPRLVANQNRGEQPQQARSVSGSLAPYTAGSLAVSSSSSSSAYATGSSSQPSSHLAESAASYPPAPPISLSLLRGAQRTQSGFKTPSWHAYEYCDASINCEENQPEVGVSRVELETRFVPDLEESDSSCGMPTTADAPAVVEPIGRRHLPTASDHELISAASDTRTGTLRPDFMVDPIETARRRWWWLSLKGWLRHHQPCPTGSASQTSSQADRSPPQPLGGHTKANSDTRYKSLRSRGGGQAGSTLQNVFSLAKADRVFRWRLIASLLVTCLLLMLLALLGHMLYARRNPMTFYTISSAGSHGRLSSLLVDDSDFDLSWLWPPPSSKGTARLEQVPNQRDNNPTEAESSLRSRLATIERGNKLEQYQLTVGHLTNMQLATDGHLDLSQLANRLIQLDNPVNSSSSQKWPKLSQHSLELASLVLLSNLNWPLIKWRHQNQQGLVNFFSFSLGPAAIQTGAGQPSSMRHLLALMLLGRETRDQLEPHLRDFSRLDELLRSSAKQIVVCSQSEQVGRFEVQFCKQLLLRYRRMMATLASLNYSHLSRLHDSLELKHQYQDRAAKTLLGFLLDRLALIEPQSLVEAALASELSEDNIPHSQVVDLLLSSAPVDSQEANSGETELLELTKRLVGEDPTRLSASLIIGKQVEDLSNPDTINSELVYPWNSNQLPCFIRPLGYDLFMQPNLTTRQLVGMVKVSLKIERSTRFLVLHSSNLHLIELSLWLKASSKLNQGDTRSNLPDNQTRREQAPTTLVPIAIRRVLSNAFLEQIYVELVHELEPTGRVSDQVDGLQFGELPRLGSGEAQENIFLLSVSFNKTSIRPSEPGLEFVQYNDYFAQPEAELKTMLYTQLESTGARHLFPCFDEPQLKARFQLNLVHERQHQVLFNSAKRERVPYSADSSIQMSVFEATPIPISSYLLCFVVCDAHNIKSITSRVAHLQQSTLGPASAPSSFIQVQIIAQFEHLSQAEFASHLVPQLLAFYQTQLQFDYPLDKLDLLAIPSSTINPKLQQQQQSNELDTMENLGLIWFKAPLLLLDTNLISQDLIEQIASMISHQLAHQYFGNIVSLSRWQDRWLFEALCQYLESSALSRVQADWKLEEQFVVATIQETLSHWTVDDFDDNNWPSDGRDVEQDGVERLTLDGGPESSRPNSMELKRSSAILHMLLFNLLPSQEAQMRLLRNCLNNFQQHSMSSQHFWRQFGHQLSLDGSMDRMLVDLSRFQPSEANQQQLEEADVSESSERIVFVNRRLSAEPSRRRLPSTANLATVPSIVRLVDNLELVVDQWLHRHAYPLVTATVYRDRVHLRQERFSAAWLASSEEGELINSPPAEELALPELGARERRHVLSAGKDLDEVWPIPLMFVSRANPKWPRFVWLDRRELELPLGELANMPNGGQLEPARRLNLQQPPAGWFKLNVNQSSLVRVNYDDRNWEALGELLVKSHYSNHMLSQLDRANLIDDALSLMRSGRLSVGLAMNLTIYLEVGERDYMPWTSALRHLDQMQTLLNQNPLWHRYVLKLVQPISSVIGWKDDGPHLMRKLRRLLFSVALQYGDERTVSKAKQEFKNWVRSNRFIVPNLQELAYVAGVRYGDQQEWFYCWQKYQQLVGSSSADLTINNTSETVEPALSRATGQPSPIFAESSEPNAENEKRQLLTALASTQNTWLLEQFLNYSLDTSKIQPRHLKHVVQTLGKNPVARLYLWRFVRLNWAALMDKHLMAPGLYKQILETMIHEATKHFATKLDLEEVKSFFDAKRKLQSSQEVEVAFRKSLQVIRFNIYWRDNIESKLTKWLSNYNGVMIN